MLNKVSIHGSVAIIVEPGIIMNLWLTECGHLIGGSQYLKFPRDANLADSLMRLCPFLLNSGLNAH